MTQTTLVNPVYLIPMNNGKPEIIVSSVDDFIQSHTRTIPTALGLKPLFGFDLAIQKLFKTELNGSKLFFDQQKISLEEAQEWLFNEAREEIRGQGLFYGVYRSLDELTEDLEEEKWAYEDLTESDLDAQDKEHIEYLAALIAKAAALKEFEPQNQHH